MSVNIQQGNLIIEVDTKEEMLMVLDALYETRPYAGRIRGPKRHGHWIHCKVCRGLRYVRPSFVALGAKYCGRRCMARDPDWRRLVGQRATP